MQLKMSVPSFFSLVLLNNLSVRGEENIPIHKTTIKLNS